MLSIFKTKQDLANIFLLPYLFLIRASIFFSIKPVEVQTHGLLTEWMFTDIAPNSYYGHLLSLGLIFIQAVFINIIANRFRFSRELSLLPGMFYCLLCSLIPEFLSLNGIVLGNTFVILALFYLLDVYKRNDRVANNIFNVGFWLGLACLFDYLYLFFLIWGIIGTAILTRFNLRDLFILLIGGFQSVFLFGVYLFYYDRLTPFLQNIMQHLGFLHWGDPSISSLILKLIFCFGCIVLALFMSGYIFRQQVLAVQKFLTSLYLMLMISGVSVLFISRIGLESFMLIALPLSIIFTLTVQRLPRLIGEFLHFGMLIVALLFQFEYLIGK